MEASTHSRALTRRGAIQAGAAGAAGAYFFLHPWAARAATGAQASADAPAYLLRSSYLALDNPIFALAGTTLRLEEVVDLSAAANVTSLRDAEDAFALHFSGPGVGSLAPGTYPVRHSELGAFDLYLGQIGQASNDQRAEVVVNRVLSNKDSRRTPPKPAPPREGAAAPAAALAAQEQKRSLPRDSIRRVNVKRTKRGARVVVAFAGSADVRSVTAWLRRGDKIVAATTRSVYAGKLEFNLKTAKRPRKGAYEIDLMAVDSSGEQSYTRKRLTF
ncbi:MAG: hypothetical protein QOJ12_2570 [Thermoleophilales bacterium]|nr:hypothetical protein [Thermoleophilales bacterium]